MIERESITLPIERVKSMWIEKETRGISVNVKDETGQYHTLVFTEASAGALADDLTVMLRKLDSTR